MNLGKNIVTTIICNLVVLFTFAQKSNNNMSIFIKDWEKVDSFLKINKPESAKATVSEILKKAKVQNKNDEIIKAQSWMIGLDHQKENADKKSIKALEKNIEKAKDPIEKAIWQNQAASAYLNYFENNDYDIYDRTNLEENNSLDIETWDAHQFHKTISALFLASIADRNNLKNEPLDKYKAIINKGENTEGLRPSIYDLLVWDAIEYFKSDVIEMTQPSYKFEIDNKDFFTSAVEFSKLNIETKDSQSVKLQTLNLYQELTNHYIETNNINALIDLEISRLTFVYDNAVLHDKKDLYRNALYALAQNYKTNPNVAQALFLAINSKLNLNSHRYNEDLDSKQDEKLDLVAIRDELQQVIKSYPNTEGAINAANTINNLISATINITVEDAYIPKETSKFLLKYKNVKEVNISLFHTNIFQTQNEIDKGKFIKEWNQIIPNASDLKTHSVELKIDALETGLYWLVVEDTKTKISTKTLLQISNLAAVHPFEFNGKTNELYILNRKTGFPIANPQLLILEYKYQNENGNYLGVLKRKINGDKNGKVLLTSSKGNNYNNRYALVKGKDTLYISENNYYLRENNDFDQKETKVISRAFLFTDRSIYRPGQIIYYKGIVLESNGSKNHKTIANKTVMLKFLDANHQIVKELEATTNKYGSFSGSFTAPSSALLGSMQIMVLDKDQIIKNTSFNVEEYKRPKFQVSFDTLKANYKLNETIVVNGKAVAYAGNNIDNAEVKYRIVRKVRYPYYWLWRGNASSEEMEIKNGIIKTNENGKFELSFEAIPDKNTDPKSLPIFTFEISVDITDINGETRSNTQYISVGYQDMLLNILAPKESLASNLKNININTTNLNGVFTPAKVKLKISSLQSPDRFYRERMWETPTDFVMDQEEYNKYFPNDAYKDEWNPENRKKTAVIHQANFTSSPDGNYEINSNWFKQSGYYEIEAISKDKEGNEVKDKQYIFVYLPESSQHDIPLFVASDKSAYKPMETMSIYVKPAIPQINLMQRNSWNDTLDWQKGKISLPITEEDRGIFTSNWFFIYNNRFYQTSQSAAIPWDNKDLDIEWASHRDKVEPGSKEAWTLTIKGPKKEKIAAELVAGLYDASLDELKSHSWDWSKLYSSEYFNTTWNTYGFSQRSASNNQQFNFIDNIEKSYAHWDLPKLMILRQINYMSSLNFESDNSTDAITRESLSYKNEIAEGNISMDSPSPLVDAKVKFSPPTIKSDTELAEHQENNVNNPPIRSNFQETAFFLPQLLTDKDGNIKIKFTLPDALTKWNFMAFAHTTDWETGFLEGSIQTQKELMVVPNLPRFFRQGDQITISTKISNLSEKNIDGTAHIEILDATTLQVLNLPFGFKESNKNFKVASNQSAFVNFDLNIPQSRYEPVIIRITAKSGNYSDGEENIIPVMTNRMLVTETQPLPIRGNNTEIFILDKLLKSGSSTTLVNQSLTIEFTGNPAWYAVQALPYLMDFPYECSEQIFSRFYANALAAHIVAQSPKIAAVFDKWRTQDTAALLSNLEKNQELKTALLEETPWVLEAKSETQRKKNIAKLFESHQLAKGIDNSLKKLSQLQNSDGSFSWFPGMNGNRYITQYILTGIAKLQSLHVTAAQKSEIKKIQEQGLTYLDQSILKDYRSIKKENIAKNNLSSYQIQYLYMRSFINTPILKEATLAHQYFTEQEQKYWNVQTNFMQGMIALTQFRKADSNLAKTIMESLSERALRSKEMGMYWNTDYSYWWYTLPIETHSLMITAFEEITKDEKTVDDLKLWLLKQKQTQDWKTTTATADACYALLKSGSDWLQNEPEVTIQMGSETIGSNTEKTEAGTGYFKKRYEGNDIKPEMGTIKVTVDNKTDKNTGTAWGALYWQYFEDMNKITTSVNESPLHISKQLFIEVPTDRGLVLKEISENYPLKVGDKIKVRIVLKADRAMEYLHMKDMRASGFEPIKVISSYKWGNGFGYYESTKDLATHFFIDYLPKGTFVFEYPLVVAQKGKFSNGISSIQCMYAPEFSAHTQGINVEVK
ncbi:MAG TPA: alpha-2-macroglobulin family protein [Edaphocola sp.]|nr:alpha-2-macroglobulin family protein [Edaphocola sp.]